MQPAVQSGRAGFGPEIFRVRRKPETEDGRGRPMLTDFVVTLRALNVVKQLSIARPFRLVVSGRRGLRACLAFVVIHSVLASRGSIAAADRPNILVIITDDQGYGDLARTITPRSRRRTSTSSRARASASSRFTYRPYARRLGQAS